MHDFWQFLLYALYIFFFIAYLLVMFQIITDLFRDRESSGWAKAIWVLFLILFPVLTALVYLIVKGKGMAERQAGAAQAAEQQTREYVREVAGRNPAQEIADAKALLDSGTISPEEYEVLKAKALA